MAVRLQDVLLLSCSAESLADAMLQKKKKKDSTGAVILQLGAMQLFSAAVHMLMIDVDNPSQLMSLSKRNGFQSNGALV